MNKLETQVARLNDALETAAVAAWPTLPNKFEGPALVYANGRLVLTETQTATGPDDAQGLHVFHAILSTRYGPVTPAPGGREKQQKQFTQLGLIMYSAQPDMYDVLSEAAARVPKITLLRSELAPTGVRKLLGLDKDANATNAGSGRYLFALIYEVEMLAGGLLCE